MESPSRAEPLTLPSPEGRGRLITSPLGRGRSDRRSDRVRECRFISLEALSGDPAQCR